MTEARRRFHRAAFGGICGQYRPVLNGHGEQCGWEAVCHAFGDEDEAREDRRKGAAVPVWDWGRR